MKKKTILISLLGIIILFAGCSNNPVGSVSINTNPLNSDGTALTTISLNEEFLYQGKVYHYSNSTVLNAGGIETLYLKTNNKTVHLLSYNLLSSASPMTLNLYENVTITANGTEFISFNRNRNVNLNSSMNTFLNPTYSLNSAVLIDTKRILGSKNSAGLLESDLEHWRLKKNTNYVIEFVNDNGNNQNINYKLNWFE